MDIKCLYCNQLLKQKAGWMSLFLDNTMTKFCPMCLEKINYLHGSRCVYCSRMLCNYMGNVLNNKCADCHYWFQQKRNYLDKNQSIFVYNEFMKEIITAIKYRGDVILASGFEALFQIELKKYMREICKETKEKKSNLELMTIPLSKERFWERGFNQVELLTRNIKLGQNNALNRINSEKQAKKTRQERLEELEIFQINENVKLPPVVLLIDDIYTTGSTLQKAAKILKIQGKVKYVYSFTLIRG